MAPDPTRDLRALAASETGEAIARALEGVVARRKRLDVAYEALAGTLVDAIDARTRGGKRRFTAMAVARLSGYSRQGLRELQLRGSEGFRREGAPPSKVQARDEARARLARQEVKHAKRARRPLREQRADTTREDFDAALEAYRRRLMEDVGRGLFDDAFACQLEEGWILAHRGVLSDGEVNV